MNRGPRIVMADSSASPTAAIVRYTNAKKRRKPCAWVYLQRVKYQSAKQLASAHAQGEEGRGSAPRAEGEVEGEADEAHA